MFTKDPLLLLADVDVTSKADPDVKLLALMLNALPVVKAFPVKDATPADESVVALVDTVNVGAVCEVVAPVWEIFTNPPLVFPVDDEVISKPVPDVSPSALIDTALPVVSASPVKLATPAVPSVVAVVETLNVGEDWFVVTPV